VDEIKVGIVGLDTSHCPAFTRLLNDSAHEYHVPGARVVGAYPGGSDLFSLSRDRVQGFTAELRDTYGVRIYGSIPALVADVDAVLLESVDGRQHLEQFEQIVGQSASQRKPVFIDKPFATSTAHARQMIQLAEQTQTPVLSSSSLRYSAGIVGLAGPDALPDASFGPGGDPGRLSGAVLVRDPQRRDLVCVHGDGVPDGALHPTQGPRHSDRRMGRWAHRRGTGDAL